MIDSIVRAQIVQEMLIQFGKRIRKVNNNGTKITLGNLTVQILLPTEDSRYVLDVTDTQSGEYIGEFRTVKELYDALTH